MDPSRRAVLKAAAILLVDQWAMSRRFALAGEPKRGPEKDERKIIVVACGGIRRAETFQNTALVNIPHLVHDLLPGSLFLPYVQNAGATSHYNTISSIITGNWQRLDDWGISGTEKDYLPLRFGTSEFGVCDYARGKEHGMERGTRCDSGRYLRLDCDSDGNLNDRRNRRTGSRQCSWMNWKISSRRLRVRRSRRARSLIAMCSTRHLRKQSQARSHGG
jgi:hypothetical protein